MDKERFKLNQGRERPAYTPENIHCPGCGAGLTLKDEQSQLVVCEFCGSHLDVSEEEKTVLGKGPEQKWEFPLKLGDSFQYKGSRFEIIARMAFIEDNDVSELTREYLLYNPRRGAMWLDEYGGNYSRSTDTHVMPTSDPFTKQRGSVLETYDGKKWVAVETGWYQLAYVDGALPWIAKVGDRIQYAEFSEKGGSEMQYDVQRIGNEIEYGSGQALTLEMVRRATGKPDLGAGVVRKKRVDVAKTRKGFMILAIIALLALAINGILALYCLTRGKTVLDQMFSAEQLTTETLSKPFTVSAAGNVIKITAGAYQLNNAWMAVDLAVVKGDETVIHVFDSDIQYYHGVEGGESWSEGSRDETSYIEIPEAGAYRLLLHAVSAHGETASATSALHQLRVQVEDDVLMPHFYVAFCIIAIVILIFTMVMYKQWKSENDD